MTLDEAKELVKGCSAYLAWKSGAGETEPICIDGWLSLKQLEAIIIVARAELTQPIAGQ